MLSIEKEKYKRSTFSYEQLAVNTLRPVVVKRGLRRLYFSIFRARYCFNVMRIRAIYAKECRSTPVLFVIATTSLCNELHRSVAMCRFHCNDKSKRVSRVCFSIRKATGDNLRSMWEYNREGRSSGCCTAEALTKKDLFSAITYSTSHLFFSTWYISINSGTKVPLESYIFMSWTQKNLLRQSWNANLESILLILSFVHIYYSFIHIYKYLYIHNY